jgi:nucleoside-diphosphate-sugar epimerase
MNPMSHHVVVGAGPVGSGIATTLAERGDRVTVLTRSGSGPSHALITRQTVDASNTDALIQACRGAATIFNCVNPPYHRWAEDWPPIHQALMTAAERSGTVLAMIDNLYGFGPGTTMPMTETTPMRATGKKGAVRARMATELLAAHAAGRLRATLARASDYYGPGVRDAALGERVVPRVIAGEKVTLLGQLDIPHTSSYMPDVVRTMVTIAFDERAWGRPWHVPNAPAATQRRMVEAFATAAGTTVRVSAVPKVALSAMGLFNPTMRELKETWYQFAEPWTVDSTVTEETFGLRATPVEEGAAATVAWWRDRS